MEYVDYYLKNLLTYINIPVGSEVLPEGGTIVLNNIAGVSYEVAVSNAGKIVIEDEKNKLLLSEKVFVDDITLQKYLGKLDAKKLWDLCVLLHSMVADRLMLEVSLSKSDEYLKLFNELEKGIDLVSINIKGTVNGKTKNITLQNNELINEIAALYIYHLHNTTVTDDILHHYNAKWTTLGKLVKKRSVDYLLAIELERFLIHYLCRGSDIGTSDDKMLVLQILYLFGRFKNNPPSNTDIYRKLMSDGKELQIEDSVSLINGKLMPFTIMVDPEIAKIREEYFRLTADKCEISK